MNILNSIRSMFAGKSSGGLQTKDSAGAITIDMLAARSSTFTESAAMKIEAFYCCVRDKSETIGQLPLKLYRTNRTSRELVLQGRNHRIFTQRPNDYMTMQEFLEMVVASCEINGAFYAYIGRNDRGETMELIPFVNQRAITPAMDINGNVYYTYSTNDNKPVIAARPEDLFIIRNFTTNGYMPTSPIQSQAMLLGIAKAQDETYYNLQTDGITAQMALKTDQVFKDPNAVSRLKEDLDKKIRGAKGVKNVLVLEQGLTPVSLQITPKDAELLGNKEFTVNRICRMTRVPIHRVGVGEKGSTSVSELDEAYMRDSLNPILVKVENAMNQLTPDSYMVEFNRKAFYAGSPWRLVEAVEREVKGGLASINEGRIDLGRETIEGGDVFAIDNNNVTYGQWTEIKEIQEQLYGQANNQKPAKQGDGNAE